MLWQVRCLVLLLALVLVASPGHAQQVVEIAYAGEDSHPEQILELYIPRDHAPGMPVHLYVHGGAWSLGDPHIRRWRARAYTNEGVILASLGYRLAPEHQHPDHVRDVAMAIRWVVDHIAEYGGDSKRVVLSGHSAGAHLAALVATHPVYLEEVGLSRDRFGLVAPVDTASLDLRKRHERPMIQRLRDRAFTTDPAVLADASPMVQAGGSGNFPDYHIFARADWGAAMKQGEALARILRGQGRAAQVTGIPDHSHRQMRLAIFRADSPIHRAIMDALAP